MIFREVILTVKWYCRMCCHSNQYSYTDY